MNTAAKPTAGTTLVSDIMVTTVLTVDPKMKLWQVAELFVARNISGAPVVDGLGRVVSMIGEGSLMRLATSEGLEATVAHCLPKMTPATEITTLRPTDTFTDAYRLFLKPNVRRVPVTSDNGQLVGLVSRGIIIRIFVEAHYGRAITQR